MLLFVYVDYPAFIAIKMRFLPIKSVNFLFYFTCSKNPNRNYYREISFVYLHIYMSTFSEVSLKDAIIRS